MKKLMIGAAVVALASLSQQALAEGYQVNSLSAKQNGMGHTGVALKLGAESQIFNPAGMAWMEGNVNASASFTAIFSHATADYQGKRYETDSPASTPINVSLGFNIYDNLKAGVTFYTPYGSNINWGENWPGAILNQKVKLSMYTIQPTVAWKILPNLSIGAGAMITWASVDLYKGLITPQSMDMMMQMYGIDYSFGNTTPVNVNLTGKARTTVGVNVGAMWDITDQWTVGASFRSCMWMKVKAGDATVGYANEYARQIMESRVDLINQSNFAAKMPCPAIYSLGVSYKPNKRWIFALDAQLTGWNAYKALDINFSSEQASQFDQHLEKKYHNAWLFKAGAQCAVTERLDLRCGLMVDLTPCDKYHYNPETPGMTKVEPSVGLSFRPVKNLSIDFALLYVQGCGANDRTGEYVDMVTKQTQTFTADYKLHAWCPSIGASVNF
ncbi:MAG: outer membrane protein transport protein [Bacteroidales bacterium]|nr:outer membrane protein transport protein [Bacteroidales bacterium]